MGLSGKEKLIIGGSILVLGGGLAYLLTRPAGATAQKNPLAYTGDGANTHLVDISSLLPLGGVLTIEAGVGNSLDPTESVTVAIYGSGDILQEDVVVVSGNQKGGVPITSNHALNSGYLFPDATHIDVGYLGQAFSYGGNASLNVAGQQYTILA